MGLNIHHEIDPSDMEWAEYLRAHRKKVGATRLSPSEIRHLAVNYKAAKTEQPIVSERELKEFLREANDKYYTPYRKDMRAAKLHVRKHFDRELTKQERDLIGARHVAKWHNRVLDEDPQPKAPDPDDSRRYHENTAGPKLATAGPKVEWEPVLGHEWEPVEWEPVPGHDPPREKCHWCRMVACPMPAVHLSLQAKWIEHGTADQRRAGEPVEATDLAG